MAGEGCDFPDAWRVEIGAKEVSWCILGLLWPECSNESSERVVRGWSRRWKEEEESRCLLTVLSRGCFQKVQLKMVLGCISCCKVELEDQNALRVCEGSQCP